MIGYFLVGTGILNTLDGIRGAVVNSKLAAFSALAATLAALFAGIILLRMAHDYVSGQGITFWELVRPFVIVFLVANFNTMVASPLHRIVNIGTMGLTRVAETESDKYYRVLGEVVKNTYTNAKPEDNPFSSDNAQNGEGKGKWFKNLFKEMGSTIWDAISKLFKKIMDFILSGAVAVAKKCGMGIDNTDELATDYPFISLLCLLFTFYLRLVIFMEQCACYVNLALLTLLGPYAFALSIFQSWRSRASSWIGAYISTALWIPIQQIVLTISYYLLGRIGALELNFESSAPWLTLCCIWVSITMLHKVPSLAGNIIDAAASGMDSGPSATGAAKGAFGAAANGARAAMGGR